MDHVRAMHMACASRASCKQYRNLAKTRRKAMYPGPCMRAARAMHGKSLREDGSLREQRCARLAAAAARELQSPLCARARQQLGPRDRNTERVRRK